MSDIVNRLKCLYPIGPIQANGEPELGWRDFSGEITTTLPTPLMLEAAAEIERLRAALAQPRQKFARDEDGHWYLVTGTDEDAIRRWVIEDGEPEGVDVKMLGCNPGFYTFENARLFTVEPNAD